MKSVVNSFKNYFGSLMERDSIVNDIIIAQACRNGIVHSDGIVDDQLMKQIRDADSRNLKPELLIGSKISFETEEVDLVIEKMNAFLTSLFEKLESYYDH